MIQISEISVPLDFREDYLKNISAKILGLQKKDIAHIEIIKKSTDARKKNNIHFSFTIAVTVLDDEDEVVKRCPYENVSIACPYIYEMPKTRFFNKRPIIVGSGPSGLFCALILAECGANPIIIERGKMVDERMADINEFSKSALLDENSNIQFGEGGAGTFSDGKLTTNIKDTRIKKVLAEFVKAGAPREILYESKPHIGTDNLSQVIKTIRKHITALGGEFRFSTLFKGFSAESNKIKSAAFKNLSDQTEYELDCEHLVLAIGHSARDTYELLFTKRLQMEQKAFAIGARIEHSQRSVNLAQHGALGSHKALGAAEYKLAISTMDSRGCYTFCMCPGGQVVAAASEAGCLTVNGMSNYARDGQNANSALLVGVTQSDFGNEHPLSGMYLQRSIEKSAYSAGGGNYKAPAQLVGDFLLKRESKKIRSIQPSYPLGITLGSIDSCLPPYVTKIMRVAITEMNKKLNGFSFPDAILTACETRSSAPLRILRDITMQSSTRGIFPIGEGAGYAGGIMSAAVDGIKCAEMLLSI